MVSTELAANLFRITQTDEKLRQDETASRDEANATHYMVGREVRDAITRIGGAMPEDLLTPVRSIQDIEREEALRLEHDTRSKRQPSLFAAQDDQAVHDD